MADPVNNFGPLTPEQQAMLDRDKINESLGPFDWTPGFGTAIGAGVGALGLGVIARDFPGLLRYYGPSALLDIGKYSAAMAGIPSAVGYVHDLKRQFFDRNDRERSMMFGNPADAEGQPGGFYGENALLKYRNGQY